VTIYSALAYTDGSYVSFPDAPPPFEQTGGAQFVDASGAVLPGISRWAASLGVEFSRREAFFSRPGEYLAAIDTSYRSSFSSSQTCSNYLVIAGYALVNARIGFRVAEGWTLSWSRNLLNQNNFELMSSQPGNSGLYEAQPGDPRTAGITLRIALRTH
jgi:iron complex outermembrane receptor protein